MAESRYNPQRALAQGIYCKLHCRLRVRTTSNTEAPLHPNSNFAAADFKLLAALPSPSTGGRQQIFPAAVDDGGSGLDGRAPGGWTESWVGRRPAGGRAGGRHVVSAFHVNVQNVVFRLCSTPSPNDEQNQTMFFSLEHTPPPDGETVLRILPP